MSDRDIAYTKQPDGTYEIQSGGVVRGRISIAQSFGDDSVDNLRVIVDAIEFLDGTLPIRDPDLVAWKVAAYNRLSSLDPGNRTLRERRRYWQDVQSGRV